MKILFVIHSLRVGGATKQLALIANSLVKFGHNVTVYAYSFNQKSAFPLDLKIKYVCEEHIVKNAKVEYLVTPRRIRKMVKQINPDIVIGWRTNAGCLVALGCLGLNVKTVFCERSDPHMEDNFMLHIAKWVCNLNKYGVFQTRGAQEYYKYLRKHSIVIPNPYSCDNKEYVFGKYSDRKHEIACVGRFELVQKRQDIMLKAFDIFHSKYPDYKLSFYGDGEDRPKIEDMVNSMGLQESVIFHGSVSNVIDRIAKSKILVLSSDYEGIPNVILEAFTAGTPVVSTDCSPGGARVLIDNGENGLVVTIGDYMALAEAMECVVSDETLAIKFINNGKKKIKEFVPDTIFEKWNNYLLSL